VRQNKKSVLKKISEIFMKVKYSFSYFTLEPKSKIKEFIIYFGEQSEY